MEKAFVLIGYDGQAYNGPIAKRLFNTLEEAADHAKVVMSSGGSMNLQRIFIMQAAAVAERVQPPVVITSLTEEVSEVRKAA